MVIGFPDVPFRPSKFIKISSQVPLARVIVVPAVAFWIALLSSVSLLTVWQKELKVNKKAKKLALKELEKLQKMETEFQIYSDRENVGNYVFVYSRSYIQFDERTAQKHVSRLNNTLKNESHTQSVRYRRIHGRYFYTPVSKIVKLKYIKDRKFQTEYIVSSQNGGLGLLVSNFEDVDFEDSIKGLALK